MYHRIAEDAEERLLDPVMAFNVYVRAIKESPLEERTGEEMSIEGVSAETQAIIGKRLARVFEEELVDVAKAEETYRYVLTVAPAEPEALANLDRIYSSLEQYSDLAGILEQRAAVQEDQFEKIDLYRRLGQVYEDYLGQLQDAIRVNRIIFDELDNEEVELEPIYRDPVHDFGFYRFDPNRHHLERTAQLPIPNPWGIAFDRWGQNFFAETSSPDVRWMMPGTVKPLYAEATHKSYNLIEEEHMVRPTSGLERSQTRLPVVDVTVRISSTGRTPTFDR